ncbi:hypothetical protein niasHS_012880 [Heterodera schachtii]|uniref:Phospholipid/glycerol acyltransferase domain-containing protein n=2 Tax=Heterodera TaxID=34509 RepID=A0ABD2IDK6_HETSC
MIQFPTNLSDFLFVSSPMSLLLLSATAEHLLVLSAFFFPPALLIVLLVVVLATFGKSLGLRERYVSILIRIFEWGAGEIQSRRKKSGVVTGSSIFELGGDGYATDDDDSAAEDEDRESYGEFGTGEFYGGGGDYGASSESGRSGGGVDGGVNGRCCSMDLASVQSPTDSGLAPSPLARSMNSMPSLRKTSLHHGSSTSLCSATSTRSARARHGSGQSIIIRETSIQHLDEQDQYQQQEFQFQTFVNSRGWQGIRDSMYFIKAGVEAIIEDEVTSRFKAEQLASWNMLTRTSVSFYQFLSWKLTILWGVGFLFRYLFLLPMRLVVFSVSLLTVVLGTAVVGLFPNSRLKRWLNEKLMLVVMRIGSRAFSALIFFHDSHNKAQSGGICVANHTSPIDVVILGSDTAYALIGQKHGGVIGLIQRALSRASSQIWFERSEAKDRSLVRNRLFDHVQDPTKLPVLIFPEGTCINNTSVMMFKKGCFEVNAPIYPIAMKYDSRFGDAFWNSSEQSYFRYLLQMMTSWALICHVWYLPPMTKEPGESAISLANRVKKAIAVRGGLVDLDWDGQLKRYKVPARMVDEQRERYYQRYQRYTSFSDPPSSASSTPIRNEGEEEEE